MFINLAIYPYKTNSSKEYHSLNLVLNRKMEFSFPVSPVFVKKEGEDLVSCIY
jgi:hypothetical protein